MTPVKKTAKKEEIKKVVEEVAAADAVAEEVKAEVKKAAPKKAAAKKAAAPKKAEAPVEKAAAPAEETKKAAPKKAAAKKAAPAKAADASVFVEFGGKQVAMKSVLDLATKAYKKNHKDEIKSIEIYVKPNESVAYYVVNGEGGDDFKIEL